jgi:ribosome-associated toxin RatA of RatAB toxin-antitoxin module
MGKVKASAVSSAPFEKLYEMGHDVASFPEVFPSLKKIKVLEKSPDGKFLKAEWTAGAKLITQTHSMTWVQEDSWDDANKCCNFTCAKEDKSHFKYLNGTWHFKPHRQGTEMIIELDYEIEHPLMNPLIAKIIDGIMKRNNESLLNGLKKKAEKAHKPG